MVIVKKVWCLYRVSTKSQVNTDEDIPLQRSSCQEFVRIKGNWIITNELYERGVSGWKKSATDRDALIEIKEGAIKKQIDVLLVFMFDRIGRKEDETPLVIDFLYRNGVEVWSVNEGKRNMGNHVDKLINYISFWQSSGESLKTSIRVRESKKQLSQQGYFQGGVAPFGYEIYETNQVHWKNKDRKIKEIRPNKYESDIVKIVYDLYVNKNYGVRRISNYLNENSYKTRYEKEFGTSLVNRILTNTIYIGYRRYKSYDAAEGSTQQYNKVLQIISDDLFESVQQLKRTKNKAYNRQDKTNIPTKGKLLFSGIARCQYCTSKLTANYLYRNKEDKNGNEYKTIIYRYSCPLNKGNNHEHKQYVWGAVKYDKIITNEVKKVLSLLDLKKYIEPSKGIKKKILNVKMKTSQDLKLNIKEIENKTDLLNMEIVKVIDGSSQFTAEQLSKAIISLEESLNGKRKELDILKSEIIKIKDDIQENKDNLEKDLKNWQEKFDKADHDRKKVFLANLIDEIYLGKDYVSIIFNLYIDEIIKEIKSK